MALRRDRPGAGSPCHEHPPVSYQRVGNASSRVFGAQWDPTTDRWDTDRDVSLCRLFELSTALAHPLRVTVPTPGCGLWTGRTRYGIARSSHTAGDSTGTRVGPDRLPRGILPRTVVLSSTDPSGRRGFIRQPPSIPGTNGHRSEAVGSRDRVEWSLA